MPLLAEGCKQRAECASFEDLHRHLWCLFGCDSEEGVFEVNAATTASTLIVTAV